jgi:hypothetical protein
MAKGFGPKKKDEVRFTRCETDFWIYSALFIDGNSCLLIHKISNKDDKGEGIDESNIS